jgi:CheY-like chemotaxis protein/HPt (histidine-containing phosphotransfer) domain-containing protein
MIIASDPQRLQQVLNNLLNNALKFTERGHVELNIYLKSQHEDQLFLLFEVIDSGIGIEENMQSQLFQPFTQLDHSTTRPYGGSGLGLAICKRLIGLFQGQIGLESHLNKGSRFWFKVPMRRCDPNAEDEVQPLLGQHKLCFTSAAKLLVVEDNLINQVFIQETLQRLGANVTVVENGALAVQQVQQCQYDAVLMDCHMPEMDGFAAVEHIRAWEQQQQLAPIPIIALTANAMHGERDRCLKCGMNDYLTKPVVRELLLHTLQKWLPSHLFDRIEPANTPVTTATSHSPFTDLSQPQRLVDENILNQLHSEIGEKSVNRLINLYLNELPNYFQQINESLIENNVEALYLAAHKFKGASKNLGVNCFIWYCEQLEAAARDSDLKMAHQLFTQLLSYEKQIRQLFNEK